MDKNKYINTRIRNMEIFERKTGSRFIANITENGKRRSFYGSTKAEVRNKAKEWLSICFDSNVEKSTVTLGFYMEYWMKTYKRNKIEQPSYERLESVYQHQIKNTLGNVRLCDLTPAMIQGVIDNYACPENEEDLALAISGLKKFKEQINACLKTAVAEDLLVKNPCSMVVIPNKYCVVTPTKKQLTLSDAQIEDLKQACLSKYKTRDEYRSRDGLVLLVILALGLRVGEALALNWNDFNFEKKIVHIRKTVQYSKKKGTIVKDGTKTDAGDRILPINDNIIMYLNELKKYDERNHIKSRIVCCTATGARQNARNLQRSLTRILGRTEIEEHVSLHTLRHTFGSCLLRKGVQIEVVSKLMGHSAITVTFNKYIHVLQEQQAMAMQLTYVV